MKYNVVTLPIILLLGACGGSSSNSDSTDSPEPTFSMPNSGNEDADILLSTGIEILTSRDELRNRSREPIDLLAASAPESGEVMYEGFTRFRQSRFLAIGSFSAEVDFGDTPDITASADDFYEVATFGPVPPSVFLSNDFGDYKVTQPIEGSIEFDYGFVNGDIRGTVNGSITASDGFVYEVSDQSGSRSYLQNSEGRFFGEDLDVLQLGANNENDIFLTAFGRRQP